MLLDLDRSRRKPRRHPPEIPRIYRKAPPSELMMESDGRRYRCDWIERGLTIHSDGNVSCGLDDPNAERSFGNINDGSIAEIFDNEEYERLRLKLWNGSRCSPCSLYEEIPRLEGVSPPERPQLPTTLVVEPSVRCNIRCDNRVCDANNDRNVATRETDDLDVDAFVKVIDEIGAGLDQVFFYNYGDPFMHRSAEDMLIHLRDSCARARIVTSTNGIPLRNRERAAKVAQSRVDQITFTISGMTQESYVRYHAGGRLDHAIEGLKNVCEAREGAPEPRVEWRYLVFNWNDSFEEIDRAIALSQDLGVDRFTLMVTHIPDSSASWRLAPGTPGFERYRDHIELAYGYVNAALPDAHGLYHVESIPHFGEAQWTSLRSRLEVVEQDGSLRLALSSNREVLQGRSQRVLVRTPWQVFRTEVVFGEWSEVTLPVPEGIQGLGPFSVELIVDDAWFPADELGNGDRRCLGVLVEHGAGRSKALVEPASRDEALRFARR